MLVRDLLKSLSRFTVIRSTTQGIMSFGALIGAGGFALGVASQAFTGWVWARSKARPEKSDRRNLAMVTLLALDDYVGACYGAVHDTPEFNQDDHVEFAFHSQEPVLALPKDVDWRLLGDDLGEAVMWFSNRVANLENALDSLDLSKHAYDGFFERRLEGYSRLAATAMDLIARIEIEFDLKLPHKPDYYHQDQGFLAILRDVDKLKAREVGKPTSTQTGASNVTPLFPKTS
jgi:hypothetical protein